MKKWFWVLIVVIVSFIIGVVFVTLFPLSPYKDAFILRSQGDKQLEQGVPNLALKSYQQAEDGWPVYRIDPWFQQQKKKAEEDLRKKVAVIIFLKEAATDTEAQSLVTEIKKVKGVSDAKYISKEDALKTYQERNKDHPELAEFVTADILPASIEVYLDDLKMQGTVSDKAKSKIFVAQVIKFSLD